MFVTGADDVGHREECDMKKAAMALLAFVVGNSAFAIDGTATVTGGEVQYFGAAEVQWLGSELLIKYTGEGSFILPGLTKARILAVGGGGGGAGICSASSAMANPFGAGAGGGAGGLVEVTNVFPAATYAVAVGAGGAGGASSSTHAAGRYNGATGGDITLTTNGVAVYNTGQPIKYNDFVLLDGMAMQQI